MLSSIRYEGIWDMLLTYARAFAMSAASVEYNRGQINGYMVGGKTSCIKSGDQAIGDGTKLSLSTLRQLCSDIPSLSSVCYAIDRVSAKIEAGIIPLLLYNELETLQHRIMDELREHFYFPVTASCALLYNNPSPMGDEIYAAFPSARSNVCDAIRCIIFGQGTACVFHLMRVMEVGLKVLGRKLSIPYAPSWESYLAQINKLVLAPHASKSVSWKKKQPIYLDISGDLTAIKSAWRNPVMHIVRDYSSDEASIILSTVKTFMKRMAEAGFKETGKPVASRIVAGSA